MSDGFEGWFDRHMEELRATVEEWVGSHFNGARKRTQKTAHQRLRRRDRTKKEEALIKPYLQFSSTLIPSMKFQKL